MNTTPWIRHERALDGQYCVRCHLPLPVKSRAYEVVCTKDDRVFVGDLPTAKDCTP